MREELTRWGIVTLFVFIFSLFTFGPLKSCRSTSEALDTLSKTAHAEQSKVRDTVVKYDTIREKAEIRYRTKHDTLWRTSPDSVDTLFNKTFPRDSVDTTNYEAGYTQLRKALDANNQRIRDSIKDAASTRVIATCTSSVAKIVKEIDTQKVIVKEYEEKIGWKQVTVGVVLAVIAFVWGSSTAK